MNAFEAVKNAITAKQAAEMYGLRFGRNGRAVCPWHDDHKPDLAFFENSCYCFACHNGGDAVALVGKIFKETPAKAVNRIIKDFNLLNPTEHYRPKDRREEAVRKAKNDVMRAEHEYLKAVENMTNCAYVIGTDEYRELSRELENAALWLKFKKAELEEAKTGKPNIEPEPRSEFDERWVELCDEVDKDTAILETYKAEEADDNFWALLNKRSKAEMELDYMWETNQMLEKR